MTSWLRKIPIPHRETVFGLLGFWAIYLAFAVVMGLGTSDARVFFFVGFAVPALLVAVFAFAALLVAIFLLGAIAAGRVASWAYNRFLWHRFRFHIRGWTAPSKGIPKVEYRCRTGWGLLADAISGFALGLGFGGVICVPLLATGVLSVHHPAETSPWLTGLGGTTLVTGLCGSFLGLIFRLATDNLSTMGREKVVVLPPPVVDEYF